MRAHNFAVAIGNLELAAFQRIANYVRVIRFRWQLRRLNKELPW